MFRTMPTAAENVPLTIRGICEKTFKIFPGSETKNRTMEEMTDGIDPAGILIDDRDADPLKTFLDAGIGQVGQHTPQVVPACEPLIP